MGRSPKIPHVNLKHGPMAFPEMNVPRFNLIINLMAHWLGLSESQCSIPSQH